MQKIYNTVIGNRIEDIVCVSPQVTALMIERSKGYPYLETFYTAINVYERTKEELSSSYKTFITVGCVDQSSRYWYDAVVALDSEEIDSYPLKTLKNNTNNVELLKLSEADIVFDDFESLRIFLKKIIQEQKKDELQ